MNFDDNLIEAFSYGLNWQYTSFVSDNGSAPTRRQAIIWTNAGLVYRCTYASLGLIGLNGKSQQLSSY